MNVRGAWRGGLKLTRFRGHRYLNITEVDEALEVVMSCFDEAQILPKTRFALEEILSGQRARRNHIRAEL